MGRILNIKIPLFFRWLSGSQTNNFWVIWSVGDLSNTTSVTRLGNLLHFGQLSKACGNNYFAHMLGIFVKLSKFHIFLVESFLGNFYRHLATFYLPH